VQAFAISMGFIAWLAIWWAYFRLTSKPGPYEMDHGPIMGTFNTFAHHYLRVSNAIAIASGVGAIWAKASDNGTALIGFIFAVLYALLFNAALIMFFESYCNAVYPVRDGNAMLTAAGMRRESNYTVTRYSLVLGLAVCCLSTFTGGAFWLLAGLMK